MTLLTRLVARLDALSNTLSSCTHIDKSELIRTSEGIDGNRLRGVQEVSKAYHYVMRLS